MRGKVARHRRCGGNIGEGRRWRLTGDGRDATRGALFYSRAPRGAMRSVEGGDGSVRWHREGHAGEGENFVRTPASDGELDRGAHPGVHAAQRGASAHCTYPTTCAHSATQGPRWCAFDRVSSPSGAGYTRLRHRAPGAGILTGVTTGGNRATNSIDVTLHGTRR
jgi:hypothetical protein